MPRSDVVIATGTVVRKPELHLLGETTHICVLQIAVDDFRYVTGDLHQGQPKPAYLTVTVSDQQALNCAECLDLSRSVAIEAQLIRAGRSAEGTASVVGFLGRDSSARQLTAV